MSGHDLPPYVEEAIKEQEEKLTEFFRSQTGRDDLEVKFDRSPVWPDDFRGFGTNVKPRNQK